MAQRPKTRISKRIGKFTGDRRFIAVLILVAIFVGGRSWLAEHPEHDPWAPLDLTDPPGWATEAKLRALQDDVPACRAVLDRSEVAFTALDPAGDGQCARPDRTRLDGYPLSPDSPPTTCPVAIALELWQRDGINPAAQEIFGSEIARIEHLGAYSCRRLYGRESGGWSEHATGNAIDIAGFVLEDGTRISVLGDWEDEGDKGRFLHRVRDGACRAFSTVLSPDYNAAHADHFHLDMSGRWSGLCR
ncbi:MAG: extensin family protein [Erythrobacter sp.]|nr:extensin family protein [Erythrobacter sp.]